MFLLEPVQLVINRLGLPVSSKSRKVPGLCKAWIHLDPAHASVCPHSRCQRSTWATLWEKLFFWHFEKTFCLTVFRHRWGKQWHWAKTLTLVSDLFDLSACRQGVTEQGNHELFLEQDTFKQELSDLIEEWQCYNVDGNFPKTRMLFVFLRKLLKTYILRCFFF